MHQDRSGPWHSNCLSNLAPKICFEKYTDTNMASNSNTPDYRLREGWEPLWLLLLLRHYHYYRVY